jgi:hypothetical protein
MRNPHTPNLCHSGSMKSRVGGEKHERDGPPGRPPHCWLVILLCAIIFRVNRSPSTVS